MKLNNTITRLTQKPTNSVTVTNMETAEKIICNTTGKTLIEKYGTVEGFFESLYKNGIKTIKVADRNPHGTTTTPCGEPYTVSLVPAGEQTAKQESNLDKTPLPTEYKAPMMPSLAMPGMNGLGMPEIYKVMDYQRLERENSELKSKNERLTEDNRKQELELIEIKNKDGKSAAKTEATQGILKEFKDMAAQGLSFYMASKGIPVPDQGALAGAGTPISQVKQVVVELLKNEDDNTVFYIGKLIENLHKDEVFEDFDKLIKTHKLAP